MAKALPIRNLAFNSPPQYQIQNKHIYQFKKQITIKNRRPKSPVLIKPQRDLEKSHRLR